MGRAKYFHSFHVHLYSNVFDSSANQFRCAGMGCPIIRRLAFDRPLTCADCSHGSGVRYGHVLHFSFFLITRFTARCYFYFYHRCRSQSAFPWDDKWTCSNCRLYYSSHRSCIVNVTSFVLRGEQYSRWFWGLRRPRLTLGFCSIFRNLPPLQTMGST